MSEQTKVPPKLTFTVQTVDDWIAESDAIELERQKNFLKNAAEMDIKKKDIKAQWGRWVVTPRGVESLTDYNYYILTDFLWDDYAVRKYTLRCEDPRDVTELLDALDYARKIHTPLKWARMQEAMESKNA